MTGHQRSVGRRRAEGSYAEEVKLRGLDLNQRALVNHLLARHVNVSIGSVCSAGAEHKILSASSVVAYEGKRHLSRP
jgi:hypothetical protein